MNIIIGGTGHVGSEVARNLLLNDEHVMIITHSGEKISDWEEEGAEVALVDVHDSDSLHKVLMNGGELFLINPNADPKEDTVKEEKKSLYSILEALEDTPITKIVAESTYGARLGDGIGDLGILHEMEESLKQLGIPHAIIRAAFYMSNWDAFIESAKNEGVITTMYPEDFKLPMVAPEDLGEFASKLLNSEISSSEIHYVEGPEKYSPRDVANAFSKALGKEVKVNVLKEEEWLPWLMKQGFSQAAAESMVRMTEIIISKDYEVPKFFSRGKTSLDEYIAKQISH